MTVNGLDVLDRAARKHPDAREPLAQWLIVARDADWRSLLEVRQAYPSADGVVIGKGRVVTVFNIAGNKFRLLTLISYRFQVIDVIALLTHAEYSKDKWKRRL